MATKPPAGIADQSAENLDIAEQLALIRDLEVRHEDLFKKLEELETRVTNALLQWGKPLSATLSPPPSASQGSSLR